MKIFLTIIWLYLPSAFANMAPVVFDRVKLFSKAINIKLFGENKTYRGFFFGIIFSIIIAYTQKYLNVFTQNINIINYSKINILYFGFMMGFCSLFGDLIKSFIKRMLKIAPGKPFIPFDEIDWILGANIFLIFYTKIRFDLIIYSIVILGILHILVNIVSYKLKIRKTML